MDANSRRNLIMAELKASSAPVSATRLAGKLGVSRQVIVGDVALMRAGGEKILSTPRGYVFAPSNKGKTYALACVHGVEDTEKELNIMVDNGCTVIDVIVEHPVYGELTGTLQLSSRYDVRQFIARLENGEVQPLSSLTGGVHIHNLDCPDEECFLRTKSELKAAGFLYEE